MMTGVLAFALQGAAAAEWEPSLIENGSFADGTAAAAAGWSAGFFDGAQGSVTRVSGGDKERPNMMELKFNQPAKGMIQLQSKPFRLPTDGPRRFRLVTQHNGAGLIQIRFYAVEKGKGLVWLKRQDGSPVQLEQPLKPGSDWQKTVSEWTLSKERLAQNAMPLQPLENEAMGRDAARLGRRSLQRGDAALQPLLLPGPVASRSVQATRNGRIGVRADRATRAHRGDFGVLDDGGGARGR